MKDVIMKGYIMPKQEDFTTWMTDIEQLEDELQAIDSLESSINYSVEA